MVTTSKFDFFRNLENRLQLHTTVGWLFKSPWGRARYNRKRWKSGFRSQSQLKRPLGSNDLRGEEFSGLSVWDTRNSVPGWRVFLTFFKSQTTSTGSRKISDWTLEFTVQIWLHCCEHGYTRALNPSVYWEHFPERIIAIVLFGYNINHMGPTDTLVYAWATLFAHVASLATVSGKLFPKIPALPSLKAQGGTSVSGISSGADFAVYFAISHSSSVQG